MIRPALWSACAVLSIFAFAPARGDEPTGRPVTDQFQWLVGAWRTEQGREVILEAWWPTGDGALLGSCALGSPERPLYELMTIRRMADGKTALLIRHFRGELQPLEEEPVRFDLVASDARSATFERTTGDFPKRVRYEGPARDHLRITLSGDAAAAGSEPAQKVVLELSRYSPVKLPDGEKSAD